MAEARCPVCGQKFDTERTPAMPFCSKRCKAIDLKRWLGEEYSLPHDVPDDDPGPSSAERN